MEELLPEAAGRKGVGQKEVDRIPCTFVDCGQGKKPRSKTFFLKKAGQEAAIRGIPKEEADDVPFFRHDAFLSGPIRKYGGI